jgi:hypothetical protein
MGIVGIRHSLAVAAVLLVVEEHNLNNLQEQSRRWLSQVLCQPLPE